MEHRRRIVGPAFILAVFTLMTGQARAGLLDFTQGIGGQAPTGNQGSSLTFLAGTDPTLTILANFGFPDNDPLFLDLMKGGGASPCLAINCGSVYWGPLGIEGNPTGLGVQDVQNELGVDTTPTPAIDNHESLIFWWPGEDVFASDLKLSFYGLTAGSEQVHIAVLFAGSDGSGGYDFNESVTVSSTSPTSTFSLNTIQEILGHNLASLVVYANGDNGNRPFGVTALDNAAPEPGSALLLTTGLAVGLLWARKRRHARP